MATTRAADGEGVAADGHSRRRSAPSVHVARVVQSPRSRGQGGYGRARGGAGVAPASARASTRSPPDPSPPPRAAPPRGEDRDERLRVGLRGVQGRVDVGRTVVVTVVTDARAIELALDLARQLSLERAARGGARVLLGRFGVLLLGRGGGVVDGGSGDAREGGDLLDVARGALAERLLGLGEERGAEVPSGAGRRGAS